ncbi:MAG: hypothetical protein KJZ72_16770 [Anaerolineales bacterium]|nr:hypothetical protein [Anaerolineales bacterium]
MPNRHFEKVRQKYPRAYEKWSVKEDLMLRKKYAEGLRIKDIAEILQRQPAAIKARLSKYEINYPNESLDYENIDDNSLLRWELVFQEEMTPYIFPNPITEYMKINYRKPAIYRWMIQHDTDVSMYIGETVNLCPDRLLGYLSPGPTQQTNIRINNLLQASINVGANVKFEILQFDGFFIKDLTLSKKDLEAQEIRRIIEKFLISLYKSYGFKLLNL